MLAPPTPAVVHCQARWGLLWSTLLPLGVWGWCPSPTAITESPFTSVRGYLTEGPVTRDLDWRDPTVVSTTGSYARPRPSHVVWSSLGPWVCADWCESLLRRGPSPRRQPGRVLSCREPPRADSQARWCGEGGLNTRPYPIRPTH